MFLPLKFLIGSISAITALAASDRSFFTSVELRDTVSGYDICTDPKHWFMIEAEMFISEGQTESISLTIPEDFTSLPETPFHLLHKSVEVGQVTNHENMLTVSFPTPPKENITATFNFLAKLSPGALTRVNNPLGKEYAFETSQNDHFKQLMHFQAKNLTQITVNGGIYNHNRTAWFTVDIPVDQLDESVFITSESKAGSPKYIIDTTLTRCEMIYAVDAFHEPILYTPFAPVEDKSSSTSINMRFNKTTEGKGKYLRITYFTLPLVHRTVGSQVSFSKRATSILKRDVQDGLDLDVYANSYVNLYQREENGVYLASSSSAIYSNSSRPQSKSYSIPSSALSPSVSSTRTVPLSLSSGLSITFATSKDYTTESPITSSVNTVSGSLITNSLMPSTTAANSTLEVSSSTLPPDTSTSISTSPTSTLSGISSNGLPGKSSTSIPASNSSETLAPTSSSEIPNENSQLSSSYSLVESASVQPSSLLLNTSSMLSQTASALPSGTSEISSVMPRSSSGQVSDATLLSAATSTTSEIQTSSILINSTVSSMSPTITSSSYQTYSVITSTENGEVTSFTSWFPIATENISNNGTVSPATSYETYSVIASTENGEVTSFTSWFPIATETASNNVTTTSAVSYETYSVIISTQGVQVTSYTSWYPVSTLSKETSASVTSQSSAYSVITGTIDGQTTSYTSWFPTVSTNVKTAAPSSVDSYETYTVITGTENGEVTSFTSWFPVATESASSNRETLSATPYETYSVITSTENGQVTSFTSWFPVATESASGNYTSVVTGSASINEGTPSASSYETYSVITSTENGQVTSFTSWFPVATESVSTGLATPSASSYETYSVITSTENGQITSFTSWFPVATESVSTDVATPSATPYETYSVITSTENGEVTSFTSWFPVATESASSNRETLSATPYETYSVITSTENGQVTSFTSWFPVATESASSNYKSPSATSYETYSVITTTDNGEVTTFTSWFPVATGGASNATSPKSCETYSAITSTQNGQITKCTSSSTSSQSITANSLSYSAEGQSTYSVFSTTENGQVSSGTIWFPITTEKSSANVLQTYALSSSSQDEEMTSTTLHSSGTKSKSELATATTSKIFTTIGGNKTIIRTSLYPITEKSTTTSAAINCSTNTYSLSVTRTNVANTPSTLASHILSTAKTPLITQKSSTILGTSGVVSAAANRGTTLPLSSTTQVNWEPTATDYTISYQSSTARIESRSSNFTTPVAKTSTILNGTQAATATGEAELPCSCVQIVETLTRLPGGAWSTVGISQSPLPASTATPSGIVAKRNSITTKTTSDNRTSSIQTYQDIAMRQEMSLLSCVFGFLILIL